MMMSALATPQETPQNQSDRPPTTSTTKKEIVPSVLFKKIGYPKSTGYRVKKKLQQKRRAIRMANTKVKSSMWQMIKSRMGFMIPKILESQLKNILNF